MEFIIKKISQIKKSGLRLLIFAFVLEFAVIIFICGGISSAWFAQNKKVESGGMSVSAYAENDFEVAGYTVYRYNEDDNLQADESLIMRQYDTIFIGRNELNAVIIKIDVQGIEPDESFGVKIFCTPVVDATERYMSDIVSLRAAALYLAGTNDEVYNAAKTELSLGTYTPATFRTVEGGVETRTSEIIIDSLTMPQNGSVYIMIDYYYDLIEDVEIGFGEGSDFSVDYEGNITAIELFTD